MLFDSKYGIRVDSGGHRYITPHYLTATELEPFLNPHGFSLRRPGQIREAILWLSEFYAHSDGPTPWDDPRTVAAYLTYYAPLNIARLQGVLWEAQRVGFPGMSAQWIDLGAGPAPLAFALKHSDVNPENIHLVEPGSEPRQLITAFSNRGILSDKLQSVMSIEHLKIRKANPAAAPGSQVFCLSYSLNESFSLLDAAISFRPKSIMLLEPSTKEAWPDVARARSTLIEKGYYIWAPCTHQGTCPLAPQGQQHVDWCHDRIHPQLPSWIANLDLPLLNNTITGSYLLASLEPPPHHQISRLIGDPLIEKGKVRQLICQEKRSFFIRWRPRKNWKVPLSRGALVKPAENAENKREVDIDASYDQCVLEI